MRALTVRQPWATLLADPSLPKWIETRGHRTNVRGRVAIHAAVRRPGYQRVGDYYVESWYDEVRRVEDCNYDYECGVCPACARRSQSRMVIGTSDREKFTALPFGAVLGTVDLYDCVPIGGPYSFSTGIVEGGPADFAGSAVIVHHPPLYATPESLVLDTVDGRVVDITDQLPYGDFAAGRWAWLTRDAELFDEPVPAKGRQGWWEWTP